MPATKKIPVVILSCTVILALYVIVHSIQAKHTGQIAERSPEELAELLASSGGAHDFSKHFTQEDVPALMALLEDPKYVLQWANAMLMASAVDKQHESQPSLIRYIKWDHEPANFDYGDRVVNSFTRFTALAMLGFVADEQGIELLETVALSNEGLYSVTGDWIHRPIRRSSEDRSNYLGSIRARAALGLIYSQNQPSIARVERLHRETVNVLRNVLQDHNLEKPSYSEWHEEFDSEEKVLMFLYEGLIDVLAVRDAIEKLGIEEFRRQIDGGDMMNDMNVLGPYMGKYVMQ